MPGLFKDLSKKASDLLSKGFDSFNSVKVNTTSPNGVNYSSEIKSKGSGKVAGKVGAKFKHSSGINVKKLELANNGTLTSQVHLEGAIDNTTLTLDVALQPLNLSGKDEKCEIGVDYSHEKARFKLGVSPVLPTAANLSVLVQAHDNVLIGGSYSGQLDDSWVHTSDNVGVGYTTADTIVTLNSTKLFSQFNLAAHRQHSNDIALAAEVGLSSANPSEVDVTVGGSYTIDADTSVKAKVNVPSGSTEGAALSLGFNQKINGNVRLTAASRISLDPQEDLFGANFALGLQFGSV